MLWGISTVEHGEARLIRSAGMAGSFTLLSSKGLPPAGEVMPKAESLAIQAISCDESEAEAHAVLGAVHSGYEWSWTQAEANFRRALQANGGSTTARHWDASECLAPVGRLKEAASVIETAEQLDPLSPIVAINLGFVYIMSKNSTGP